ncbi:odorant receptor 33b-like [Bactrocera neohumeralis]|uniref:odorant receptor 33b-like n=1 Tax=Bactrocera tryoni TaxID=59916 RepID=UPI001A96358E|nr:odorant receptor 33b-like [Bactrocera tryoni]XP_050327662.1 odorant receptor 33b-like [Bactrocera neohumeralis]
MTNKHKPLHATTTLDTTEAFKYIWSCWRLFGMHRDLYERRLNWVYLILLNLYCGVIYPMLYIGSFFTPMDLSQKLANISVAVPILYTFGKHVVIVYYIREDLPKALAQLKALDRLAETRSEDRAYMQKMVKNCHLVFFVSFVSFWFALLSYGVLEVFRHKLPFEGWVPFDWTRSEAAYVGACAIQLIGLGIETTTAVCCDTYAVTYLILLVAHLRVLNGRIERVGSAGAASDAESYRELVACVEYHKECMSYYNSLRPTLSGIYFIQFLSTGLGLSMPAIAFVGGNFSFSHVIKFLIIFGAIIIEVAPCCWFMDEVLFEMRRLTNAMFSCRWYEQNLKFRNALIIFMQRSQIAQPVLAGNLIPVSLETFTNIIKFAFSLFTLLNQLNS